jgi:hypothetical protein
MSKTFSKKIDKNFDVSFSSTFFVLSRFRVFLSDGSSKTHKKTLYKKHRVEKLFTKIRPKIQNRFFLDFFNHVFGRFSVRGVRKHDKKYQQNKSDPIPFSYSDPPTDHGGRRLFFCRPLVLLPPSRGLLTATAGRMSNALCAVRCALCALGPGVQLGCMPFGVPI